MDSTYTDQMNSAYDKQKSKLEKSKEKNDGRITKQKPNFQLPRFKKGDRIKVIGLVSAAAKSSNKDNSGTEERTRMANQFNEKDPMAIRSCSKEGNTYFYAVEDTVSGQLIGMYAEHELSSIV